jgi:hypothetical protein
MSTGPPASRSVRGLNARKALPVLLSDDERTEMQGALDEENNERGLDLGLGSKLRELGLLWARSRRSRHQKK